MKIRELGRPGDLGWVVSAHGERYAEEFGWDTSFEAMVARIVAAFGAGGSATADSGPAGSGPSTGARAWIAELDGRRVGCVFCVPAEPGTAGTPDGTSGRTAVLRLLLVDPAARGHGLGARLVSTCVEFARSQGYDRLRLWTNDVLAAARHLYMAAGFRLVAEEAHHSFGADLVGQYYELDLKAAAHRGS
jgi:GNAT superfamily N-acetyltransferase